MLLLAQPHQIFSLNFPWLKLRQKGIIWWVSQKKKKGAFKGEQNKWGKKKYFWKRVFKKSLWSVFSPMCLIYIYSQRSKGLLVWENRQSCHWLTNGEPQPDYHTKNHQHQTPLMPFPSIERSWTSTCVLFWLEFKEMTQTICVSHPHAVHTWIWRPHTASAHTVAQTQMLTYAGI